ncbi:tyrosinase family protein [Kitasatospora aburaviensis]
MFIGGDMGDPSTAAQDAIYFSFHTFIDLLWAEWQRRDGAPVTSPDHDLRGFLSQAKHKVADFADTVALGYEYEYTERLKKAFAVPVPAPVERSLLATRPLSLVAAPDFATQMREASRAQFGLVAAPKEGREVVVRLDELKIPLTGSYLLHAYVHPGDVPFRADDAEFADRYGVGYAVLWRAHAGPRTAVTTTVVTSTEPATTAATTPPPELLHRPVRRDGGPGGVTGGPRDAGPDPPVQPRADRHRSAGKPARAGPGGRPEGRHDGGVRLMRTPVYELHIKPLFRATDREHMAFSLDLWDYDSVVANADDVLARVDGAGMPRTTAAGRGPKSGSRSSAAGTRADTSAWKSVRRTSPSPGRPPP